MSTKIRIVRVKNPSKYQLTKGKKYPVVEHIKKKVRLVNDNNVLSWYSLKLFHEPQEEEGIHLDDFTDFKFDYEEDVLTFSFQDTEYCCTYDFTDVTDSELAPEGYLGFNASVLDSGSDISCGVRQISGVNAFMERTALFFSEGWGDNNPFVNLLEDEDLMSSVLSKIFSTAILSIMENTRDYTSMFVVSTQTDHEDNGGDDGSNPYYQEIKNGLAPFSIHSETMVNRNSGNVITFWLLEQYFEAIEEERAEEAEVNEEVEQLP